MDKKNQEFIDSVSDQIIKSVQEKLEKNPIIAQTKIVGQPRVTVDFPEYQKIKGVVKIVNEVKALISNLPAVQKIKGIVKAQVDFPEVQKVAGTVKAIVTFPELQKIQGKVDVDFPEVQKVAFGDVLPTDIPTVEVNGVKVVPIVLFDGKRMVNPFVTQIEGQGRLTAAIERLNNNSNDSYTPVTYSGVSNSVVTVRSSQGRFGGYYYTNPNTSMVYLQVFLDQDIVTLGTTAPNAIYGIPAGGAANMSIVKDLGYTKSLKIAATTQPNGAAAPSTSIPLTLYVK